MADKEPAEIILDGPAEFEMTTPAGVSVRVNVPKGNTAGIACRTAENAEGVRTLTTIKTGPDLDKVVFNFGAYGGIQTRDGGDPGGGPPCP